jgi:integrase
MPQKLSEKIIKNLTPPEQGNCITYDTQIPGFGVRVTSAGAVSFVLNYWVHGRERRITIGKHPEWTVLAARNRALDLRREINDGEDPLEKRKQERTSPTMNALAEEFFERHVLAHKRPSSIRNDREMLEGIILPKLGQLRVEAVGKHDLEDLHQELKATPYRGNRVLALLSTMFAYAIEKGWRPDNPARGITKFPEDRRERWLLPQELERFIKALNMYPDQNAADALRLLLLTGSREMEVLKSEWPQFDLERGVFVKPSHSTKEKKTEHVPLSGAALELLTQMKAKSGGEGFLFPGLNGDKPRTTLRRTWVAVCKSTGLTGVRIHDLRHSFASSLVSQGVSLHIVGKLLGHSQAQTTQRYAHIADEALREASNKFGDIFQNAGAKKETQ